MNTIQLKQELIYKILRIEDIDFLNALKSILDYKKKDTFIEIGILEFFTQRNKINLLNIMDNQNK